MGAPRHTTESYTAKLFELNPTVRLVGEFTTVMTPTLHRCTKCKHRWKAAPSNLTRPKPGGCPQCKSTFVNLTGQTFGRVRVLKQTRERNSQNEILWLCECACGKRWKTAGRNLRHGDVLSCGCERTVTHGLFGTRIYKVYRSMLDRCYVTSSTGYDRYGGRGIRVCKRWRRGEDGLSGVECFVSDMGQPPKGKSLDRREVNGHYTPKNCRWVSWKRQCRNRRNTLYVTHKGRKIALSEATEKLGLDHKAAYYLVRKGVPFDKVVRRLQSR